MTLRKVSQGEEFDGISAQTWNAIIDAVRAVNDQSDLSATQLPDRSQYLIEVRNDTDDPLERFAAVGLDDVVVNPTDDEAQFIAAPCWSAIVPTFDHRSRFAILQESLLPKVDEVLDGSGNVITPASDGQIGSALLYGVTAARIDVRNLQHRFVQPAVGAPTLETVDFGGGRVLWPQQFVSLGDQWAILLLTGNGQATTGERISGRLVTHLPSALTTTGAGREPGAALLQVYATDPANTLETQARNRYAITGVNPTNPGAPGAGQSFEIGVDAGFRLVEHFPFQVVDSTDRDGTYRVDSFAWDAINSVLTINTQEPIPVVLDPITSDPVVDGAILIPGGDRRIPSDRYELVENYGNRSASVHAWCQAVHDGAAYIVDHVDP